MKSIRFGIFAAALATLLSYAPAVKADEIEVQFSGVITNTDGAPGMFVGEGFTGGFSYSTSDPFDVSIDGQSTYSLTSPEDNEFVSVGSFSLSLQPLSGVNAFVAPGPSSYFLTQDFVTPGTPGISISFYGGSDFLSSQALPDPLNTLDITSGNIGFSFSQDDADYSVEGNITQVSAASEPHGLVLVFGFTVLVLLYRRPFIFSRS